jgi:hypothetical protein
MRSLKTWITVAMGLWIGLTALIAADSAGTASKEAAKPAFSLPAETFPSVSISGVVYSNVTIVSLSSKTLTFSHKQGMASVNAQKLTNDELIALKLIEPEPEPKPATASTIMLGTNGFDFSHVLSEHGGNAGSFVNQILADEEGLENLLAEYGVTMPLLIGIACGMYLFVCLCLLFICAKTERPSRILVWIPVLQMFPAYRAANMSPIWFRLLIIDILLRAGIVACAAGGYLHNMPPALLMPALLLFAVLSLVHLLGWVIFCFKICVARQKSPIWGLFMLFPVTQPPTLAYLAFSK